MNTVLKFNSDFYIPVCNIDNCNGILKLDFDLKNFTINYKCEKNKAHIGENISIENFEKYNIKTKRINKCSKCSLNLEIDWEYKCNICNKLYCPMCLFEDEHIKPGSDDYISRKFNKCQLHNYAKNNYCIECAEYMCDLCKKNDTCKTHNIKNILDMIPSINNINSLSKKIKEKKIYIQNIIISLDKWLSKLRDNINTLKKNLEGTIEIFEKLFTNFSQQFLNYAYHSNFTYFKQLIDNENDFLNKFYNSKSFEEQTKNLFELLGQDKPETKEKKAYLKQYKIFNNGNGKLKKINDKFFFYFSDIKNIVNISFYINNKDDQRDNLYFYKNSKIDFKDIIYSISPSINLKKIYVCLSNKKSIKIFDLDLAKESMKISDEQIKSKASIPNDHFNKCIELGNDLLATADNCKISIWRKNRKNFLRIADIKLSEKPFDLLLVNNDYFVSSLYLSKKIIFISIEKNEIIDEIKDIDTVSSEECFILYKDFIIVNCIKGFALLSKKSKNLIKYINNFEGYYNKKLCIDNKDYLYILDKNNNTSIMKIQFNEGDLVPIEKYENLNLLNNEGNLEGNVYENILINNENIIVWGKAIYVLKK